MLTTAVSGAAGLLLLFLGGEALVRGASSLALRMRISPLVIGLTVVAFGTSAPELVVSLEASLGGVGDIALGNVIGSNIANIALILGVTALVRATRVEARILRIDVPLMVLASLLLVVMLADGGLARFEGGLLLAGLVAWISFTALAARRESQAVRQEFSLGVPHSLSRVAIDVTFVLGGIGALVVGGQLLIDAAIVIAAAAGVSQAVIGLTIVAVGTSLPELAASVVAAVRGHGDIAVGNVVGSNLFNVLGILGIATLVTPLGRGAIDGMTLGVFVGVAVLIVPLLYTQRRLSRVEGAGLLVVYISYVTWLLAGVPSVGPAPQAAAATVPAAALSSASPAWDGAGTRIEDMLADVDVAFLDATFYADGEIPDRDMSGFPHPFITHSIERFAALPADVRARVRFIHLNHTNPALWADSEARRTIEAAGFHVAESLERHEL